MARYKSIDASPRFLAVDLERQLLPGSFEHALHHLIDKHLDLSGFDARYRNDRAGAAAYPRLDPMPSHHSGHPVLADAHSRRLQHRCRDWPDAPR